MVSDRDEMWCTDASVVWQPLRLVGAAAGESVAGSLAACWQAGVGRQALVAWLA